MKRFGPLLPFVVLVALFTLMHDVSTARACGGPQTFSSVVVGPPAFPGGDGNAEVMAFLSPYLSAFPQEAKQLWSFSYDNLERVAAPDETIFRRAIAAGDKAAASQEAGKLIERWYAMPPVLAAPHRAIMLRAVAFLEQGKAPSPSQQFVGIMDEFRTQMPNGWSSGTGKQAPALLAKQLNETEAWLKANPQHPLQDLVTFWQARIHFFAGSYARAWSVLFQLYPKRRVRALAEMRYLMQVGQPPSAEQVDNLTDPLLIALFVDVGTFTPQRSERWWQISEAAQNSVKVALQERLLGTVVARPTQPLPALFPAQAAQPSNTWAKLRALALLQHARLAEAKEQLEILAADPEQAALLANCLVKLGRPLDAARTPQLAADEVHYVMQAVIRAAEVPKLLDDSNPLIRVEARQRTAGGQIQRGEYQTAATLLATADPEQAKAVSELAALKKGGDKLLLARALVERNWGAPLWSSYYRGISLRYAALPPDSSEASNIARYIEASSGPFHALGLFVQWLESHPEASDARAVLSEADRAFNKLVSYGGGGLFWDNRLKQHDLTTRLRRVGKRIRQSDAGP